MKRVSLMLAALLCMHCGHSAKTPAASVGAGGNNGASGSGQTSGGSGSKGGQAAGGQAAGGTANAGPGGDQGKYPDAFDPNDSPPKIGQPGCGFERAAFCDAFGGPSRVTGRGGELDTLFWSVGRGQVQQSNTRAIGIGMAQIPQCREGLPSQVWPGDDCLICQPTNDILSGHFLAAAAAQNYGQHSYRIRQPFDFAGRTGKIVFDGTVSPHSPQHGWLSLAITEDPILTPGYSIMANDEGSIIPKNAVEIHTVNYGSDQAMQIRDIHVFRDWVDTVYTPDPPATATWKTGKLNRYQVSVSPTSIEVTVTPFSEDGVTFAAPTATYKIDAALPFTRGWVQLSVHNHATLKYTNPPNQVDAAVGLFDNVGFDGPVIANWREYEIPDALLKYTDHEGDPHNTERIGYDIGYIVQDAAQGPKQTLSFEGVDLSNVQSAQLAFTASVDYVSVQFPRDQHTFRVRFNGGAWLERKLSASEALFLEPGPGPTVLDPSGNPKGDPGSQGRFALTLDVPLDQLVAGKNSIEFVSANIPTGYPPIVYNIDLVMKLAD